MAKKRSGRWKGLHLRHAALVSPGELNTSVGQAWDAYLTVAARAVPAVMETLLGPEGLDSTYTPPAFLDETELGRHIVQWCLDWGFRREYAFKPAWNTYVQAQRDFTEGRPVPITFVSKWSGEHYAIPGGSAGGPMAASMIELPNDDDLQAGLRLGRPHPFPELAGRRKSFHNFEWQGGNGARPIPSEQAGRSGAEVLLNLPTTFWDPTSETREEAKRRMLNDVESVVEAELETIECAYRAHGYVDPPEKRSLDHFSWVVRYQLLGQSRNAIATEVAQDRAHVGRAINRTAQFLGITLRTEKQGRPVKRSSGEKPVR